ncbi:MAG: cystathionine beta-lyase [Defluviicoccus sp.]|nr:cystathionine beta-lyase [Defluviicoccus sp.]MDE0385195.1 cystathionine beta-lyase [Defluviicoccus sp.]
MKEDTIITTAGRDPEANFGIVNPPVYHASTITHATVAAMREARERRFEPRIYTYGRHGTPTHSALEEAVAAVEGGERAVCLGSGLAAINAAILAFVETGDRILMADNVYSPARRFCDSFLGRFGVETTYFDPAIGAAIAELIDERTRIVYVESPGSLTFEMTDIPAVAAPAHEAGAVVIMDNTWAAGVLFKPFEHGVDVSVQAATKYIVGHSDVMMGTVTTSEALWPKVRQSAADLGANCGPDDVYLALRGLRTLGVRLRQHHQNGLVLARWLQDRPEVDRVLHPALPDDPGHALWKRDFTGACGLFGVVLKPAPEAAVAAMLDGMELFSMGASWGGFESLILPTNPAAIRTATRWDAGPTIRIHAGLEDTGDLIGDLDRGLARLNAAR